MTIQNNNSFKFPSFQKIAGNLFFVVLLIYSIVYAVERITYIDSAWLFFERVNGEKFSFPGNRYGAFFSEIPLFIATKLHLSFNILVYVFSISYVVLFYFVWRICTYTLKNPAAGLIIIFGMIMGVREVFLFTVSETHQCIVYSALLFAMMQHDFNGKIFLKNTLCSLATILVLFTHPMGIFTSGFVLLYYFVERKNWKDVLVWIVGIIIISFAIFNFLHPANPYDAMQYAQLTSSSTSHSFFNSAALHFLTFHFAHFYWLPELAGLIVAVWLIAKKEWLKLAAVSISVIIYLIIASFTFYNGDSSIMLERIFLPAFFMINLVLADLLANEKNIKKWIAPLLILFFIFNGIHYINVGCLMYKKRVAYLDEIVQKGIAQGSDQYFLSDSTIDKDKIIVPWALGTETLIYSKFKYNKCISISPNQNEIAAPGYCRLTSMMTLPVGELNQTYFHLSGVSLRGNAYRELK